MVTTSKQTKVFEINIIWEFLRENINVIIFLIMILMGGLVSDKFFTMQNFNNLVRQISVNGVMAAGFTLVVLSGGFDLSVGSTLSLCGVLAMSLQKVIPLYYALGIAILVGAVIGLLNGFLIKVTRGGLSETFLITLGVSLVGSSLALTYTKGYRIYYSGNGDYLKIGQGSLFGISISAIIMVVIFIVFQIILKKTAYGRKIYLVGGNKEASYLSGININRIKISVFVIAGICASIAGIMLTSRTTAATYNAGAGYDFDAAIATFIGGNILGGGKGGMLQTVIGVLILGMVGNILNLAGVGPSGQLMFKGLILLVSIWIDSIKRK